LDGAPLVERVVRRVLPLAAEVLFSANAPERFAALARTLPVPSQVVADRFPRAGPLAGLHAGLCAAQHDWLLALAADMPFVNQALLRRMIALAEGRDAVVPQTPHPHTGEPTWEPLHALYRRSCLPAIEARLAAGERQMVCFYPDIRVTPILPSEIRVYDPELRSFLNINTPDEWVQSQRIARG
jgi:molybdopterin-guanine dinucleotide biosynthesis protein A